MKSLIWLETEHCSGVAVLHRTNKEAKDSKKLRQAHTKTQAIT